MRSDPAFDVYYKLMQNLEDTLSYRHTWHYDFDGSDVIMVCPMMLHQVAVAVRSETTSVCNRILIMTLSPNQASPILNIAIEIDGEVGSITAMCMHSSQPHWILTGHQTGFVCVWDTVTGYQVDKWTVCAISSAIRSLESSPTGKYVAVGTANGAMSVWDGLRIGQHVEQRCLVTYSVHLCSISDEPLLSIEPSDAPTNNTSIDVAGAICCWVHWLADDHLLITHHEPAGTECTVIKSGDDTIVIIDCMRIHHANVGIHPVMTVATYETYAEDTIGMITPSEVHHWLWYITEDNGLEGIDLTTKYVESIVFIPTNDDSSAPSQVRVTSLCEMRSGTATSGLVICLSDGTMRIVCHRSIDLSVKHPVNSTMDFERNELSCILRESGCVVREGSNYHPLCV